MTTDDQSGAPAPEPVCTCGTASPFLHDGECPMFYSPTAGAAGPTDGERYSEWTFGHPCPADCKETGAHVHVKPAEPPSAPPAGAGEPPRCLGKGGRSFVTGPGFVSAKPCPACGHTRCGPDCKCRGVITCPHWEQEGDPDLCDVCRYAAPAAQPAAERRAVELENQLMTAWRERDEARAELAALDDTSYATSEVLRIAERERDEARAEMARLQAHVVESERGWFTVAAALVETYAIGPGNLPGCVQQLAERHVAARAELAALTSDLLQMTRAEAKAAEERDEARAELQALRAAARRFVKACDAFEDLGMVDDLHKVQEASAARDALRSLLGEPTKETP